MLHRYQSRTCLYRLSWLEAPAHSAKTELKSSEGEREERWIPSQGGMGMKILPAQDPVRVLSSIGDQKSSTRCKHMEKSNAVVRPKIVSEGSIDFCALLSV